MAKTFTWAMKSPVLSSNFGLRTETDKVFDNLVPVQIQTQSNEERKQFIRLSVELIPVGLSSSSFRKVSTDFVGIVDKYN